MTEIVAARLGFGWGWSLGEDNWNDGADQNFRMNDTFHGLAIINDALTSPPGSPSDGDTYIPATSSTGAWSGNDHKIAAYQDGAWYFYPVVKGLRALFVASTTFKYYTGSAWVAEPSSIANLGTVASGELLANTGSASNTLAASSLTALLDRVISATAGAIITRGTSAWAALPAGTDGYVLVTHGTTAAADWSAPPSGAVVSVVGNTGTITLPDLVTGGVAASNDTTLTGTASIADVTSTGTWDLTGATLIAQSPTGTADVATKAYVDSVAGGSVIWNAGTVTALDRLWLSGGTISGQHRATITATTTGTIDPTVGDSILINVGTTDCTLTASPGVPGQRLRLDILQPATAHVVTLDSTFAFTSEVTSYVAGTVASKIDYVQLIANNTGSIWNVVAATHGATP